MRRWMKVQGAVKITPAHDFNDFEAGKRNNLEMLNILDKSGHLVDDDFIPKNIKNLRGSLLEKKFFRTLRLTDHL